MVPSPNPSQVKVHWQISCIPESQMKLLFSEHFQVCWRLCSLIKYESQIPAQYGTRVIIWSDLIGHVLSHKSQHSMVLESLSDLISLGMCWVTNPSTVWYSSHYLIWSHWACATMDHSWLYSTPSSCNNINELFSWKLSGAKFIQK